MKKEQPDVTIVVPCYNEQEVLTETIKQLSSLLDSLLEERLLSKRSKILFVDDGSQDQTWKIISKQSATNNYVTGLKLARNVGHQHALLAGMDRARIKADCIISIDADLQDDITVIRDFLIKYQQGYDIVYGVRNSRKSDTYFKRVTAQGFYRFMHKLGINLVYNHADFRLLSRRALQELSRFQEANLFLRGIIPMIGLETTEVLYDRKERLAGETKYPAKKMLSFAVDGITSFSVTPIRFITYIGIILFLWSGITGTYAIIQKFLGNTVEGWSSLMISIWLIGGLQLVGIGIIGEYIGRVFLEVKKRPKYAVAVDLYTDKDPLTHLHSNTARLAKKVQLRK